jgi:hypothetical protein
MYLFQISSKAMRTLLFTSGLIAAAVCAVTILGADAATYSRSDCITKFSVRWKHPDQLDQNHAAIRTWMASEDFSSMDIPVAGVAYGSKHDPTYFVQYYDECARRLQLTAQLVDGWNTRAPIDHYNVSSDRVLPSPGTIDIGGRSWRD